MVTKKAEVKPLRIKPDTIKIVIGRTVQPAKFESIVVNFEQTYTLQESDSAQEVREALYESTSRQVSKMLRGELVKWKDAREKWQEENGSAE
jgi:hypothetical protein